MKNLTQILKDFDEQFIIFKDPDIVDGFAKDEIKTFLTSAIKGVLEEVKPHKPENRMLTIGQKEGYTACREQVIKNIKKLTK